MPRSRPDLRRRLRAASGITAGALALLVAGIAPAAAADDADLLAGGNIHIDGVLAGDEMGSDVSPAGDFNGDGHQDFLVGAWHADTANGTNSGATYLLFGASTFTNVDLAALTPSQGIRIIGPAQYQYGGRVSAAGDFNNDGRDDIVIGAFWADNNSRVDSGSAYVVFGTATPTDLDLAAFPSSAGLRIDGAVADEQLGWKVADAGDVNGDGTDDVIIGATGAKYGSGNFWGSAYVVFGSASTGTFDLASLTTGRGFRMDGSAAEDLVGISVAAAGDVNNDSRDDVIVGAQGADPGGRSGAGAAYVVYGSASPANLVLSSLTAGQGFAIHGAAASDATGADVAGGADVNGDGRLDVIVGAPQASPSGRFRAGSAYVVFGSASPATVDLASLSVATGARFDGAVADDRLGTSVALTGDLSGDGLSEIAIGAPQADPAGRTDAGAVYVLKGRSGLVGADMASLDASLGIRAIGGAGDGAGAAVAGLPDVTGDGVRDLLIGGSTATRNDRSRSGVAFLISGMPTVTTTPPTTPEPSVGGPSAPACAATPPVREPSPKKTTRPVSLSVAQLRINQRISQASIRRINAIQAWLDAGIVTGDICGGSIAAPDLHASVATAQGPQHLLTTASPRKLVIAKARKGRAGRVTLSRAQLRINRRIAETAVRRASGLRTRMTMLTGGDVVDGQVTSAQLAATLVVTAPGSADQSAASKTVYKRVPKTAFKDTRLSAAQMRSNQRLSQKALRIANGLSRTITSGLRGEQFLDGSITGADLAR